MLFADKVVQYAHGAKDSTIRDLTHVRRRHQDDCYQYNDINPTAQKKYIIKSLTPVNTLFKRCGPLQSFDY